MCYLNAINCVYFSFSGYFKTIIVRFDFNLIFITVARLKKREKNFYGDSYIHFVTVRFFLCFLPDLRYIDLYFFQFFSLKNQEVIERQKQKLQSILTEQFKIALVTCKKTWSIRFRRLKLTFFCFYFYFKKLNI